LKSPAIHPEFAPGALAEPIKPPLAPALRNAPVYTEPAAPKGLAGAFGGKKKHAAAIEVAKAEHEKSTQHHQAYVAERTAEHDRALEKHAAAEQDRLAKLAKAQERYQAECQQREVDAQARNEELTKFINDLAFDVPAAIEEYVGIVLSNSVYPDAFPVEHDHAFDLSTRELTMRVFVPEPSALPTVKEYRYVKAKDEIVATQLTAKAQKDRYSAAVHETALRTLDEIFEADRAGKIQSIALTVGVNRVAPATGLPETVPLVQVAAGRDTFNQFNLADVVPVETLKHLGAALSKNPFDLVPADTGPGVRQLGKCCGSTRRPGGRSRRKDGCRRPGGTRTRRGPTRRRGGSCGCRTPTSTQAWRASRPHPSRGGTRCSTRCRHRAMTPRRLRTRPTTRPPLHQRQGRRRPRAHLSPLPRLHQRP
jgi:restriction system protein